MALQVRLRHPLGERVIELPERDASQPLAVGRARTADVQIPSTGVSPQHCILFLHEGVWVVQPAEGQLTLNGNAISDPTFVQAGDVVRLGPEATAPTLKFEPVGTTGSRPAAASAGIAASASPAATKTPGLRPVGLQPTGGGLASTASPAAGSLRRTGAAAVPVAATPEPVPGGDTVDFDPTTLSTQTNRLYVPKGKKTSQEAVAVVVVVGLALLGGAGYVAYSRAHAPLKAPVAAAAQTPAAKAVTPTKHTLFDLNADQADARLQRNAGTAQTPAAPNAPMPEAAVSTPAVVAPDPAPVANAQPSAAALEAQPAESDAPSGNEDSEWSEIKAAHYDVRHQGLAVLKFDAYRRAHPGKFTAELDRYTDAAVNWLWWQRVAVLWKQRSQLDAELRQNAADQHAQPAGDFQTALNQQKADLQARQDKINAALTGEMDYANELPPNLESPTNLQELAVKRSPQKYADFKRHVLHYVRDNHGATWWDGE